MSVEDISREEEVRNMWKGEAKGLGLGGDFMEKLLVLILEESKGTQEDEWGFYFGVKFKYL